MPKVEIIITDEEQEEKLEGILGTDGVKDVRIFNLANELDGEGNPVAEYELIVTIKRGNKKLRPNTHQG